MNAATPQLRKPETLGPNHWFVASASCPGFGYHVRFISGRYTCGCSAHRWRPHLACRHIIEVRKLRSEVTMG
jgi:hypothetical protein